MKIPMDYSPSRLTIALALFCSLTARITEPAAPDAGVNSKLFNLLCEVLTAKAPTATARDNNLKSAAQHTAMLVSLVSADKDALVILKKPETQPPQPVELKGKLGTVCGELQRRACDAAVDWAHASEQKELLKLMQAATDVWPLPEHLNDTAAELAAAAAAPELTGPAETIKEITTHLTAAQLGGQKAGADFRIEGATTDRQTTCGKTGAEAKPGVTKALAAVALCVCASDNTNTGNKGCTANDGPTVTFTTNDISHGTGLKALMAKCDGQVNAGQEATADVLHRVTAALGSLLEEGHGNDNARGYIGWTERGNAAANCDGAKETGKGACAYYGLQGNTVNKPQWLSDLELATQAAKKLITRQTARQAKLTDIKYLNRTLIDLLRQSIVNSKAAAANKQTATSQEKQITDADCHNHKDNTTCKTPCTWHESESDPNKKCKLDPIKVEEQVAQTTAGGETKKKGKCAGKMEPECTKAPECKWDGKECKDSSILLNKKLRPQA
uniref:Variant surface glycoprotein 722 n=1 Tax=Trypanosoma brucei TaxID=5691 RepID=M4SX92_9TRYP|nr:variant surface glycoprotein 722 [Trypanosoma brucei]